MFLPIFAEPTLKPGSHELRHLGRRRGGELGQTFVERIPHPNTHDVRQLPHAGRPTMRHVDHATLTVARHVVYTAGPMPTVDEIRQQLIGIVNNAQLPHGVREDTRLALEALNQERPPQATGPAIDVTPAPAAGTWAAQPVERELDPTVQAELAAPVVERITRQTMLPLPAWLTDSAVALERNFRGVLAGEQLLWNLVQTMKGVHPTSQLGAALHADVRALVAWYNPLAAELRGPANG